jgi:membrane protease YdiL (CAAX protease family)
MQTMREDGKNGENRIYILALVLLASPFYLNDFANIYVKNWRWWLFIDYVGVKLFPLLVVLWLIHGKKRRPSEFGLTTQTIPSFLVVFLVVALVGTIIDQNGYQLIAKLPGYSPLGRMPKITNPVWNWIDLTFGLLLVGIFEELIFRGYMHTFISRYTRSSLAIVVISAVAFGLIHWSLGLHDILITSTIGVVFMTAYLRMRSLPAIMLGHFVVNFIDFAGIIPRSIFTFI